MSKEVSLKISIDKNGKVVVTPENTEGTECLDLMKFLDKIPGLNITTTPTKDLEIKPQNASNQHLQQ
jgi:hypothetical protein